ncbi:helix-turn-helix domain-containing protein [Halalkalicoccus sp. NIPERK01]|uniref:helix-turn-helix domain-containing protein n=1 Tax=Halalkalicoccus sp. NIPERK01 TaxID=3053469 RepID=UPI00256F3A71|nr:helix-turn-helix domain-containing protein [Halalkalicoccus sp. NIPERK01]MDL5362132.1 helix-turn-helix domain-containing protein [Halalkalicoccus sp. NIPERK01]
MATEATVTVPSEAFPLGTVFEALPGVEVEIERIVPGVDVVIPYFWVRGVATDNIQEAFSAHPGVKDLRLIDSVEDEYLLRVEWEPEYVGILTSLTETGVPLVGAVGTTEQWTFDIRGDTRDDIAAFVRLCRERDIPITLTALHALTPVETATESALTDAQQEALELAYERGYFESPRQVTMEDLGEDLGISQQAVASRLRRGTRAILGRTLSALNGESSGT